MKSGGAAACSGWGNAGKTQSIHHPSSTDFSLRREGELCFGNGTDSVVWYCANQPSFLRKGSLSFTPNPFRHFLDRDPKDLVWRADGSPSPAEFGEKKQALQGSSYGCGFKYGTRWLSRRRQGNSLKPVNIAESLQGARGRHTMEMNRGPLRVRRFNFTARLNIPFSSRKQNQTVSSTEASEQRPTLRYLQQSERLIRLLTGSLLQPAEDNQHLELQFACEGFFCSDALKKKVHLCLHYSSCWTHDGLPEVNAPLKARSSARGHRFQAKD